MSDDQEQGKAKPSMLKGAPRNLTVDELSLVRRNPPPPEVYEPPPPASRPAEEIPVADLPLGPRRFANAADLAEYQVRAYVSAGTRTPANGGAPFPVEAITVRCARDGVVGIVAAWVRKPGKAWAFDLAMGVDRYGQRRLAKAYKLKRDGTVADPLVLADSLSTAMTWLDYGVGGETLPEREAARLVARELGGVLLGVVDREQVPTRYLCPIPQNDVQAAEHVRAVHRRGTATLAQHARMHEAGQVQAHEHVRWPLGEPPAAPPG